MVKDGQCLRTKGSPSLTHAHWQLPSARKTYRPAYGEPIRRSNQRTKLYGQGKQYRARYVDSNGKARTRRFRYQAEGSEWLKQITRTGQDIAPPVAGE